MILITILLVILFGHYYVHHIIEYPTIYYNDVMLPFIIQIHSLYDPIKWTVWCFNSYLQFIIFTIRSSYYDKMIANDLYDLEILRFDDNTKSFLAIGKQIKNPTAILLILHTICGSYDESANFVKNIQDTLNWLPISYSRRGHSNKLESAEFNTVGSQVDLITVLNIIKKRYPKLPIYAIGFSAGSSILARYLGDSGDNSLISGGVCVSPGYCFEKSMTTMPEIASKLATKNAKDFFLKPNEEILKNYDEITFNILMNCNNMTEWHEHQWKFAGNYNSKEEYYNEHNPVYVLHQIKKPILYINALDDIAFPAKLVKQFVNIVNDAPKSIIVHTKKGSHLGFFSNYNLQSWYLQIVTEFLKLVDENK